METTTNVPDYPRGITFEQVWAALNKSAEEFEQWKEKIDKSLEKTEKIVRRNSKQMGELHNKFGKLAEHLVAPGIAKRFNEMGFHFESIAQGNYKILDEQGNVKAEIDILLENGDYIIAVEVKTEPKQKDIERHIKRLEILRESRNKRNDNRKIQGAIAGAIFGSEEKEATIEAGMYVLEQSGDTMKMDIPGDFVAREW
ncbi:MAG: YraN family protein [Treponema sp.]|jgi:predicted AAA+ superfamily ATPase|nr:YraN family protein [Treponema sp.]